MSGDVEDRSLSVEAPERDTRMSYLLTIPFLVSVGGSSHCILMVVEVRSVIRTLTGAVDGAA